MNWWAPYIGLPFGKRGRGPAYDCYGLLIKVYREQLGVELPSYADDYTGNHDPVIGALLESERRQWREVQTPQPLDAVVLRAKPWHVGIVIEPGWMLHTELHTNAVRERYDRRHWKTEGFFRWVS